MADENAKRDANNTPTWLAVSSVNGEIRRVKVADDGTIAVSGGGGTEFAEDAAHTSGALGKLVLAVRHDAGTALAADGDYSVIQVNSSGAVRVVSDTEFPAAAVLDDGGATPSTTKVGSLLLGYAFGSWYFINVSSPSDVLGDSIGLNTTSYNLVHGGDTWRKQRIPTVFKPLSAVAIGSETTVWTPAVSKKFRLMGGAISLSAAARITFKDNTAGTTIFITPELVANTPFDLGSLGNGILSAVANNVLTATSSAAANLSGTLYGTEE